MIHAPLKIIIKLNFPLLIFYEEHCLCWIVYYIVLDLTNPPSEAINREIERTFFCGGFRVVIEFLIRASNSFQVNNICFMFILSS